MIEGVVGLGRIACAPRGTAVPDTAALRTRVIFGALNPKVYLAIRNHERRVELADASRALRARVRAAAESARSFDACGEQ